MKKFIAALIVALALGTWYLPTPTQAQCNGIFPPNSVCGNPATAISALPKPTSPNTFTVGPAGISGQQQYNSGGSFGGFTESGDVTVNTTTGVATLANTAVTAGTYGSATSIAEVTVNAKGLVTGATSVAVAVSQFPASTPNTSNHPITSPDCNTTVVMGTGTTSQLTVTLPSLPSTGIAVGCTVFVKNNDTYTGIGTGHAMTLSGFPADLFTFLWPQLSVGVTVNSANTGWLTIHKPPRWPLPQNAEICWSQNGSDSNDGLGSGTGCMAHVQTAVNTITQQWDGLGTYSCAIGIYNGGTSILSEAVTQSGQSVGCYLTVNFRGNITWNTAGSCWNNGDNGITIFNFNLGFTSNALECNNANAANTCQFFGHQSVIYDINGTFQWVPQGTNDCLVYLDAQGRATLGLGTLTVGNASAESAAALLWCQYGCRGLQISGVVAFSPNITLGQAYVLHSTGLVNADATYTGSPTVSASTIAMGNSVLITNGTSIPGGTTTQTGGQVCSSAC